jgi:hypothetical protein
MSTRTNPIRCLALTALLALLACADCTRAASAPVGTGGGSAAPGGDVVVKGTGGAQSGKRAAVPRGRRKGPAPLVTAVRCLGSCGSHNSVRAGGRLQLRGRHFASGMTVLFPRKPGASVASARQSIAAPLRLTRSGWTVAVPLAAHSGKIQMITPFGKRSPLFGPIRVLAPLRRPNLPPDVQPTGTAFDGTGMWIWYVSKSNGGDLASIIAQAQAAGVSTLFIKSSDGSANYWSQFSPGVVQALHAAGLKVCAWQYVYGTHPDGEAALGVQAAQSGADCLVIDAESEYEGNYSAAQTYLADLRASLGSSYPIGLASFPYVDYHERLPYSVFLGPGGAQFNLPQMYWRAIGTSVDNAFSHTYHENRLYSRPILPLGQTYGGASAADIFRFRQLAFAYASTGVSFWDWQETTAAGWQAVGQALTPASDATVDNSYPLFSPGAKGDQVLWMQEHLAAAEPQTPTSGIFDTATESALLAFQASRGLPQTGQTDTATWQALLALAPVPVSWTGSAPQG